LKDVLLTCDGWMMIGRSDLICAKLLVLLSWY